MADLCNWLELLGDIHRRKSMGGKVRVIMDMSDEYIESRASKESLKLHPKDVMARARCKINMIKRAKWARAKIRGEN